MRNTGTSKLHYLLYALLAFALTGCGASNLASTDGNAPANGSASVAAKLVWGEGKSTAKTVASAPAAVTSIKVVVTGTDVNGAALPVVKGALDPVTGIGGIYPGKVTLAVKALDASSVVLYEGFAIGVVVTAGATSDAGTIVMSAPVAKTQDAACIQCHESTLDRTGQNLVADFKQSGHYTNDAWSLVPREGVVGTGCAGCHGPSHNDANPAASGRCAACHTSINSNHATYTATNSCNSCHSAHNTQLSCITCHSVGMDVTAGDTNDGVRAIVGEFSKRSHHVTGRGVKDSDCAVCHLEGKVVSAKVAIDKDVHANSGIVNLRNGNTGLTGNQTTAVGAGYAWDPTAPNHTLMDQFCFSCHNAAGAPTAAAALAGVTGYTGTALNPFGDSVSNSYDQISRINVVGVYEQFDTANSSHHAVRGQKYTTKNLSAAAFTNISTNNMNFNNGPTAAPIAGVKAIAGTMFELGKFTSTYTTLNNVAVADDSVLHCGDCHTVGQFRAADVNTATGSFNKGVIGAHGSNNEYLLRNSNGDDTLAKDALVCYICHAVTVYGFNPASPVYSHDGVISNPTYCNGNDYNTAGLVGTARLKVGAYSSVKDRTVEQFSAQVAAGTAPAAGGGNIFGNKCLNCHNASDKKTFGGIHGNAGNATYQSYSGSKGASDATVVVNRKPYRFLPGLGNVRYNGGDNENDWTVKTISQANKQGCYTLNGSSTSKSRTTAVNAGANVNAATGLAGDNGILGSWGACTDHAGTSVFGGRATTRTMLRPLTY